MLTETEKAYLAGFFDGDGCVMIKRRKRDHGATIQHYVRVQLAQANEPFLQRWRDKTQWGQVNEYRPGICHARRMFYWNIYGKQAESFLKAIYPYVDIKQEQVFVALQFRKVMGTPGGGVSNMPGIIAFRELCRKTLRELKDDNRLGLEVMAKLRESWPMQDQLPGLENDT